MLRSVSTKRCSVSSAARSIGVWDVPSPRPILAIAFLPCSCSAPLLSSPRKRGPSTAEGHLHDIRVHSLSRCLLGPRFRGDDSFLNRGPTPAHERGLGAP